MEYVKSLAANVTGLESQAKALRAAHDGLIDEIDVISLIVKAKQDYYSKLEDQITVNKLAGKSTKELEKKLREAKIAFGDLILTLSDVISDLSLTNLSQGIESAMGSATKKLLQSETLGDFNKNLAEITSALSLLDTDKLERIFGVGSTWPEEIQNMARNVWEQLQGASGSLYKSGETLQETAERVKREAEEAARKAQEAFRARFEQPAATALKTGDWLGAMEAVQTFARMRGDLTATAAALSDANGEIIDQSEVLSLIAGSYDKLTSNLDALINVTKLAGEDASKLEDFKQALEDIIDPLGVLKKTLRDISGQALEEPATAAESFRELFIKALEGGAIEATWGDIQKQLELSQENLGDIYNAAQDVVSEYEAQIKAMEFFGLSTKELQKRLDEFKATIRGTTVEMMHWEAWLEDTQYGPLLEQVSVLLPEDWQHQMHGFFEAFDSQKFDEIISKITSSLGDFGKEVDSFLSLATALATGNPGAVVLALMDALKLATDEIKAAVDKLESSFQQVAATISRIASQAFSKLQSVLDSLIGRFENLITSTECYRDLQSKVNEFLGKIANLFMTWILPIIALLDELLGSFGDITEAASSASEELSSLNVPTGYKVTRAEWKAATPGEPGILISSGGGSSPPSGGALPTWVTELFDKFKDKIDEIVDGLSDFIDTMSEVSQQIGAAVFPSVLKALSWFTGQLDELGKHIQEDLLPIFVEYMPTIIEGALDFFFGEITAAATFFLDTLAGIAPSLADFASALGDLGKQLPEFAEHLSDAITPVINSLLDDALTPLVKFIAETVLPDLEGYLDAFGEWWKEDMDPFLKEKVFPAIGDAAKWVYDKLKELVDFLGPKVMPLLKDLWKIIEDAWNQTLKPMLKNLVNWIEENWPTIKAFIEKSLKNWIGNMTKKLGKAMDYFKWKIADGAGDTMGALRAIFTSKSLSAFEKLGLIWSSQSLSLRGKIFATLAWQVQTVVDSVLGALRKFAGGVQNVLSGFAKGIGAIVKGIADAVGKIFGAIGNVIGGIAKGIGNFFGGIWSGIRHFFGFQEGGLVPGPLGKALPAIVHGGEYVIPASQVANISKFLDSLSMPGFQPIMATNTGEITIHNYLIVDGRVLAESVSRVNRDRDMRMTGSSIGGRHWRVA